MDLESIVPRLRWFFLASAAFQLLTATLLFPWIQRRILEPMLRYVEANGKPAPALLQSVTFWRVSSILMTLVPLGAWWALGTRAGVEFLARAMSGTL